MTQLQDRLWVEKAPGASAIPVSSGAAMRIVAWAIDSVGETVGGSSEQFQASLAAAQYATQALLTAQIGSGSHADWLRDGIRGTFDLDTLPPRADRRRHPLIGSSWYELVTEQADTEELLSVADGLRLGAAESAVALAALMHVASPENGYSEKDPSLYGEVVDILGSATLWNEVLAPFPD